MKENEINKELKEIAPFLSKLDKKEEGYQVPFNYFDVLPDQIMVQVQPSAPVASPTKPRPSILDWLSGLLQPRYALAFATLIGALLVIGYIFTGTTEAPSDPALLAANVSPEEARLYVQENLDLFAIDLLAEDESVELDYNNIFDLNESDLQQYIEDEVLEGLEEDDLL